MFGKQSKNVGKKIHGENVHIGDETIYYTTISVNLPAAGDAVDEYCGHEADLEAVLGMLNEGNRVLIHTWGGLGKTEFARKLAQRGFNRRAYLIDCSDSPASALAKCAEGGKDESERTAAAVKELNELDNGSLIIFDNVQNGDDAKYIINRFGNAQASILVTSRLEINRGFSSGLKSFELKPLDDKEAVEMFRRYHIAPNDGGERRAYSEEEKQTVEQIVGLSGNHTLTLELLAKTCRFSGKKPSQILSVMREKGFSLEGVNTKISANNIAEDRKFIEHLEMLFDITGISEEHPELIPLLKKLCVLDVTQIPSDALVKWCCEEDNNGLNELAKLGWLREKGLEYTMHNVVSEVLRQKLHPTFADIESTAKVLKKELKEARDDDELRYKPQPAQAQTLALLNAVKEREKLLGDIALTAGFLSEEQGSYENALWLKKRCVEIYETVLSDDSTELATAYNNTALVYNAKGEYDHALEYHERALAIVENVLGMEHPYTAASYNNTAEVYRAKGEYDHALEYHEKALAIVENVLGSKHPYTATSYNNIAEVYRAKGEYDHALEYYEKALAIVENVLGKEHPNTATSYNNIARVYYAKGEYDLALEYHEKALAIREKVLGREHPSTATSYNNIAGVYYAKGEYDRALEYHEKALAIYEKVLGKEHPHIAGSYNNIAGVYYAKGEYDRALEYYEKALAIIEKVLGKEHPHTAISYNNIALVYYAKGEYDLALEYYEKALAIIENVLGKEHPHTATSCHNIGALFYKMGRLDDAAANLARAYSIRKKCGLEKDAQNTLSWLSDVYSAKGGDPSDKAAFGEWVKKLISSLD